jgi:DNA-binding beta-propeller fold protein YncE
MFLRLPHDTQPRRRLVPSVGSVAGVCLLLAAWPCAALQINGLQAPQSFLFDPAGQQYFISNANGDPDAKDNNGFITRLDRHGAVTNSQFIHGGDGNIELHAPKGLAIAGPVLYVADLDSLRGFDKITGKPVATITFPPSPGHPVGLADVVADAQGILYVTDLAGDAIYRVDPARQHRWSVLVRDEALAGPRGVAVHPRTGHLIVASWHKGKLLEVTPGGAMTELVSNGFFSKRFHNLDGIDFDRWGNLYIADFSAGKIWRMRPDLKFTVIAEYLPYPADIGIDRENHLILVPYLYGNAAEINGLEAPVTSEKKKRTLADYGFTSPSEKGPSGEEGKGGHPKP